MSFIMNNFDFDIDEWNCVCCLLTISETNVSKHIENLWRDRELFWCRSICKSEQRISYSEVIHKLIQKQFSDDVRRVIETRLNQRNDVCSVDLRIFDEKESQSDFYSLIRSFELIICLWMISREHEQFRIQFAKHDRSKLRNKFEISIWDYLFWNISICYKQSIEQCLCSVDSCSCEIFENYDDFLECFACYD
jgi:hypothetical protein